MWLLNETTGEMLRGRCKATNLCRYCQRLYVIETVEMLVLDAMENAPTCWVVLTAREHLTRAECRQHLWQLRKAARRRWPGIEWFVQVEFQRRGALHLNLLIKGVPAGDAVELRELLSRVWCSRVDAEDVGQWGDAVLEERGGGAAVVKYLSKMLAHGLKAEQSPPIGWRGHRTSQTRGYLVRPASVMREEAKSSLAAKRRLWKAIDQAADVAGTESPPADLVEFVYEILEQRDQDATFKFVNDNPAELRWSDTGRRMIPSQRASTAPLLAEGNDRSAEPALMTTVAAAGAG